MASSFFQPRRGYRFSSDSIALAEFIRISRHETLLDLGTGVGVVPILTYHRFPFRYAVVVELQPELADLARKNVKLYGMENQIHVLDRDIVELVPADFTAFPLDLPPLQFDVICANPPFWALRQGRINPNPQKALARHELRLGLAQLVHAFQRFLATDGRIYLMHSAERETEILDTLGASGFQIVQKRYGLFHKNRKRLLLECALLTRCDPKLEG